jgi:hypothetical protein
LNLKYELVASPLDALQGDGIAIVKATPDNLRALAAQNARVHDFCQRGGKGSDHWPANLTNGFTADDSWRFTYSIILDAGHKTKWTMDLPNWPAPLFI